MIKLKIIVLITLIVLTILFIFSNSLRPSAQSAEQSSSVVTKIMDILKLDGKVDKKDFHFFIRKMAHFTEFFILGVQLFILKFELDKKYINKQAVLCIIMALIVALSDEFIQSFSDRVNSIWDVLLDTFGATCGILITALLIYLLKKHSLKGKMKKA